MSIRRDIIRRRSFSYRFKKWFFSSHKKEIEITLETIGEFILSVLFFGLIFVLPHLFH